MEQTLFTKDIRRIYHPKKQNKTKKKARRKLLNLPILFVKNTLTKKKKKKKKIKNKMAFYISNNTVLYKIRHFLVCLLQRLFPLYLLLVSTTSFPSVKTEHGHGLTISVLKYIYIYNFSFLQNSDKNAGRSIQYERGCRSS